VNSNTNLVPLWKRFRYRVGTILVRAFRAILPRLPYSMLVRLAHGIGWLAYQLAATPRRIALANLDLVFGDTKTRAEKELIACRSMQNLTSTLLSLFWSERLRQENLDQVVVIDPDNLRFAKELLSRGNGGICASFHYGNWELHGIISGMLGIRLHIAADTIRNKTIEETVTQLRSRTGNRIIQQRGAAGKLIKALRQNECAVLLIDQNAPEDGGGMWMEFFGVPVFNNITAAGFALHTGAPIMTGVARPMPDGRLQLIFGPEIPYVVTGDREADLRRISQDCLRHCEKLIREHPEFWIWSYKRWKHRRDYGDNRYPFYTSRDPLAVPSVVKRQTKAPHNTSVPASSPPNV
jgi:KDO2-lipid IV(A) lauroyltransferase